VLEWQRIEVQVARVIVPVLVVLAARSQIRASRRTVMPRRTSGAEKSTGAAAAAICCASMAERLANAQDVGGFS